MEHKKLIQAALEARIFSYSPYSGFAVGAALLCEDGSVYTGCNIARRALLFLRQSARERDDLKQSPLSAVRQKRNRRPCARPAAYAARS